MIEKRTGAVPPWALIVALYGAQSSMSGGLVGGDLTDDHVDSIEDALSYYMGLKAAGVPVELHAYAQVGHAFALRPSKLPVSGWPQLAERWMQTIGMISE